MNKCKKINFELWKTYNIKMFLKITLHFPTTAIFTTFRVLELVIGTSDSERVGLSVRRLTRLLAPQVQENPIYFHMTDSTSEAFRATIDQLVEVGFEMVFYSFGR